jgi:predicted DsbA family dithiol-disulfide isomerase
MIALAKSQRFLLLVILLACASGAWVSGEMLKAHDGVWGEHDMVRGVIGRLCDAGSKVRLDCAGASRGRYSEFTLPIPRHPVNVPTAFLGLAYFVTLGAWFVVVGGTPGVHRAWRLIPAGVTLGGLGWSGFLVALMVMGLAKPCAACIAVHGINLVAVFAIWRFFAATQAQDAQEPPEARLAGAASANSGRRLVFVAVLTAMAGTVGLWSYRAEHLALRDHWRKLLPYKAVVNELRGDRAFLLREHLAEDEREFCGRPGETVEAGRPRLVAFVDYQCPSCGPGGEELIENARRAFGDRLDVVRRHYPLCADCNAAVEKRFHPHACEAAWAAEAARLQGGAAAFEAMHRLLMDFRGELNAEALRTLAVKAGLDAERLAADLKGEDVRRAVAADVELAGRWGVKATPAFFLDGRRIDRRFEGPVMWDALAGRGGGAGLTTRSVETQPAALDPSEGGGDARPPGGNQ